MSTTFKTIEYYYDEIADDSPPLLIHFKPHNIKRDVKKRNTLFVTDLLPFFTESILKHIFSKLGPVTKVYVRRSPKIAYWENDQLAVDEITEDRFDNAVAYVEFDESISVEKAFEKVVYDEPLILTRLDNQLRTGFDLWKRIERSAFGDVNKIRRQANNYMRQYDLRKIKEKENKEDVDDEGFITPKGKHVWRETKESGGGGGGKKRKRSKKPAVDDCGGMYSFKIKESKMQKIMELRKKFEEDRKRVAELKASRSFNPFR